MTNNNPFLAFLNENNIAKSMKQYQDSTMDWQTLFEIQRRNAHAWSQAGQVTMNNLQNMSKKQRMLVSELARQNSEMATEAAASSPEQRIESNNEIMKNWAEKTAENMQEVSGMLKKSQEQANEILNTRLNESMDEMKSSMKPKAKDDKAA